MSHWNKEASLKAATILGKQMGMEARDFCEYVVKYLAERVVRELVSKSMEPKTGLPQWTKEPAASELLDLALNGKTNEELSCTLKLTKTSSGHWRTGQSLYAYGCVKA